MKTLQEELTQYELKQEESEKELQSLENLIKLVEQKLAIGEKLKKLENDKKQLKVEILINNNKINAIFDDERSPKYKLIENINELTLNNQKLINDTHKQRNLIFDLEAKIKTIEAEIKPKENAQKKIKKVFISWQNWRDSFWRRVIVVVTIGFFCRKKSVIKKWEKAHSNLTEINEEIMMLRQRKTKIITDFSPHVLVEGTMKLNEFNNAFQTEQQCLAYIANLKENKCIRCFSFNLNTSDLKRMRCLKCNQTFSILTGTIFSRSQTSLTSWFYLIFRWINTKHGIPSTDVAKELGVTLKTAWRMIHKIRTRIAKQKPQFIVEGTVQIDEMYLSHMGFKKQGRSLVNKTLIVGVYQKTTNNLIVKVLKNANSKNLLNFAKKYISSKCHVYTDSWKGYCDFKSVFTKHETVNHQDGYVSKNGVNTNQIESVWKHIRRTFKTHIKVAKHHVHLYAKEAAYKFNKIPSFETVMLCLI